ncbi:MAG TPA: hypothetical protein VK132_03475 [Gemmatimonadales bacterium]|nr:hypothetical protein [Gemmatimonadales bacterium]
MKTRTALIVLAALMGLAGTAAADETTFCNFFITTLPYTITTQGHYCFNVNLSTAITTGNAITINSDFVVVDLNNFKLGGGSAGLATNAIGISSVAHRNITIRNGNIRGFKYGISLTGSGGGHLIENNVLDGNTYYGVRAIGDLVVVRNNIVSNTGGTTTSTTWTYGIYADGTVNLVRDNVIANTFSTNVAYGTYGIGARVTDHNLVKMGAHTAGNAVGMWANQCRDNTVLSNTTGNAFNCTQIGTNFTDTP